MLPITARCTKCEQPKQCDIALGGSSCWCFVAFDPAWSSSLSVPDAGGLKQCVCQACVESAARST